jgi:hypothetical protein
VPAVVLDYAGMAHLERIERSGEEMLCGRFDEVLFIFKVVVSCFDGVSLCG